MRNRHLIQKLVNVVRLAWRPGAVLLVRVDGLCSYAGAFWVASREKVTTGKRGRPPHPLPEGIWLARGIKSYSGRHLSDVVRRVLWGTPEQVAGQLQNTRAGQQINTSDVERRNATFRACLAGLTRRGRRLVKDEEVLEKGTYLVGCVYNVCKPHRSLRVQQTQGHKWLPGTPAMAAGWADRAWSIRELLSFRVLHA